MENATKALLIAAAVLIAILIISFSLIIYNMASETVGNVNLSEAEMTQFNAKFKAYEGNDVSGSQLNALMKAIISHNQQEKENKTNRYVTVDQAIGEYTRSFITENDNAMPNMLTSSKRFKVYFTYTDGLISKMTFETIQ